MASGFFRFRPPQLFFLGTEANRKKHPVEDAFPGSALLRFAGCGCFSTAVGHAGLLEEELLANAALLRSRPVIIDEVQKLPDLLDEVHRLIEKHKWRFVLCGSSARKLMQGGGNLLGGRPVRRELLPLVSVEIPDFSLDRALNHGLLPPHYLDESPADLIAAYVGTYLREEILAESLVRSLPTFQRFLQIAAISNGQPIQFASIAREVGLSAPGVRGYFEILVDTLFGSWMSAYQKRQIRRTIAAPRFYFFDVAVVNDLGRRSTPCPARRNTEPHSSILYSWN